MKPIERVDQAGLVWLLHGKELIALTQETATMRTKTGATQTYHRKNNGEKAADVVLAWELEDC